MLSIKQKILKGGDTTGCLETLWKRKLAILKILVSPETKRTIAIMAE